MAFARNPAARRVGFRLQSPSILRVASTGESTTRRRTRAGSQSTNKLARATKGTENQWVQVPPEQVSVQLGSYPGGEGGQPPSLKPRRHKAHVGAPSKPVGRNASES